MNTAYQQAYRPPAPILPAAFRFNPEQAWLGPFDALVDTGADTTIIPKDIAQQLKALPVDEGQLVSQWGDVHAVSLYFMEISVGAVH